MLDSLHKVTELIAFDVYNRIKNCVLFEKEAVSFLRPMLLPEKVNIELSVDGAK